jgi:hypothetical protein
MLKYLVMLEGSDSSESNSEIAVFESGTQKPQYQMKKQTTTRFWRKSMQFKSIKEREVNLVSAACQRVDSPK